MAPKRLGGRSKKVLGCGYERDAALEAMRLYGFQDDLIKTTLDELLEVYNEENWELIEEDGYQVLLEAILAKLNPTAEETLL